MTPRLVGRRRDRIPVELRALAQWVTWRKAVRHGRGTKVPYTPDGRRLASCNDPATWGTFDAAVATFGTGAVDGIGFQIAKGQGIVGIDLDHCIADGEIESWAMTIVERFDTYTEVSPSSTGIRMFAFAAKPGPRCRKAGIEVYGRDRFLTVTGRHVAGTRTTLEHRQAQLNALYSELWPEQRAARGPTPTYRRRSPRVWEVIMLASRAANSTKFECLMRGDTAAYGGDDSAADLALCNIVAFYSRDPAVIDGVVRQSGLMREKWERVDYRERTIKAALNGVSATHTGRQTGVFRGV